MQRVLVASTDDAVAAAVRGCFGDAAAVATAASEAEAHDQVRRTRYDYLFLDVSLLGSLRPNATQTELKTSLRPFWMGAAGAHLVILAVPDRIRDAVHVVKAGAADYLTLPLVPGEVRLVVDTIEEHARLRSELTYLRDRFWQRDSTEILTTRSPAMQRVFDKVKSVAPTKTTVLVTGESGTGKGVIAQLIHRHSSRATAQFIGVHCGAMPDTLIESELFGHERGAFTGAHRRKAGKFEIARGGTLFLDEIGTVTPAVQIKLLQVLQERTFYRVGGESPLEADVRVIAASNSDLGALCSAGTFRRDLFYRLNVFPIEIPPLRERSEDVPLLARAFLDQLNVRNGKGIDDIHPDVLAALSAYGWPGNIRELENVLERAYILEASATLTPSSFPSELFEGAGEGRPFLALDASLPLAEVRRRARDEVERQYLTEVLRRAGGRINAAAAAAGISVRQVHKLMTRHGIRKEDFRGRR